MNERTNEEMNE